jgi:hypothetical protein
MSLQQTYVPVENVVDHAVQIWVDVARKNSTDNGSLETQLQMFASELKCILMEKQLSSVVSSEMTYVQRLQIGRGGNSYLSLAALKAGVFLNFPYGSQMLLDEEEICFKGSEAEEFFYHYPLHDGRWLVAQLSGNDMPMIVKALNEGKTPEFNFYEAQ